MERVAVAPELGLKCLMGVLDEVGEEEEDLLVIPGRDLRDVPEVPDRDLEAEILEEGQILETDVKMVEIKFLPNICGKTIQ